MSASNITSPTRSAPPGATCATVSYDLPADAFLDDCHLNDEGNRVVAEDLARALERGAR
jgi:lysophospholipase L1-like esterase